MVVGVFLGSHQRYLLLGDAVVRADLRSGRPEIALLQVRQISPKLLLKLGLISDLEERSGDQILEQLYFVDGFRVQKFLHNSPNHPNSQSNPAAIALIQSHAIGIGQEGEGSLNGP